jgi:ABC-type uncharacterized transport system YnjBCD permease subunit
MSPNKNAFFFFVTILLIVSGPAGLFFLAIKNLFINSELTLQSLAFISSSLFFGFKIALTSCFISVLFGHYFAYCSLFSTSSGFFKTLSQVVVSFPHMAFAYLLFLMLYPEGFMNRLLTLAGASNIFPNLVNDRMGIGIIAHYCLKEIPFVFLLIIGSSNNELVKKMIKTAKDLGLSRENSFFKTFLPNSHFTIIVSSIVTFSYSLGSFEAPYILGHSSKKAPAVEAFQYFLSIAPYENKLAYNFGLLILFLSSIFAASTFYIAKRVFKQS